MSTGDNLAGLGDIVSAMPYVRWALSHTSDIPDIINGAKAVRAARGLDPKWDAVKANGDNVVAILRDFPNIDQILDDASGPAPNPFVRMATLSANPGLMACFDPQLLGSAEFQTAVEAEAKNLGVFGDGTIIKLILENLPAILSAVVQLFGLFR